MTLGAAAVVVRSLFPAPVSTSEVSPADDLEVLSIVDSGCICTVEAMVLAVVGLFPDPAVLVDAICVGIVSAGVAGVAVVVLL